MGFWSLTIQCQAALNVPGFQTSAFWRHPLKRFSGLLPKSVLRAAANSQKRRIPSNVVPFFATFARWPRSRASGSNCGPPALSAAVKTRNSGCLCFRKKISLPNTGKSVYLNERHNFILFRSRLLRGTMSRPGLSLFCVLHAFPLAASILLLIIPASYQL
jgi:hypothetical protein